MENLIKRAKDGDKEAFTELMLSIEEELYRISKVRLKNEDNIADAIQNTMLIAFKSIKRLKHVEYFKTWIIRILVNECNYIYRKNKKVEISYEDIQNDINISEFDKVDEKLDFDFICSKLDYKERMIIILYYKDRFTDKEIGKILNIKENTVKTKRTRIKQKIKKFIKKGDELYG